METYELTDKESQLFNGDMTTLKHGAEYLDKNEQRCRFIQFNQDDVVGLLCEHVDTNGLPHLSFTDFRDIKPVKTPEQMQQEKETQELEDAKIKQIGSARTLLIDSGFADAPLILRCLQSHGRLAEIILPQEKDDE